MSEEEFEKKMQEMEDDCNIGPEASEFIKEQENYIKYMEENVLTAEQEKRKNMCNVKSSHCPFTAKHCKYCGNLYCSDREYETPSVTVSNYNIINMEQKEMKELSAQEIVEKLIDEKKISGKEAVILLNAINKPAEVRIEKEYTPYTPYIPNTTPWYQPLDTREPKCYESGGTCTNPHKDCINCPGFMKENYSDSNITYTAATINGE